MAQFLIKAQEPWNNDKPTIGMSADELVKFNVRSRIGDIIVVRPDDHVWGKEECLPRFIVVKLTNLSYKDAKHFEESLFDTDGGLKLLKSKKWKVPSSWITSAVSDGKSVVEITLSSKQSQFINNLTEKTS